MVSDIRLFALLFLLNVTPNASGSTPQEPISSRTLHATYRVKQHNSDQVARSADDLALAHGERNLERTVQAALAHRLTLIVLNVVQCLHRLARVNAE